VFGLVNLTFMTLSSIVDVMTQFGPATRSADGTFQMQYVKRM
jgi:hypothetical protein